MKTNNYNIEKIIDALYNKGYTNFLTQKELMLVKNKINKNEYNIFSSYEECSKVILYKSSIPDIKLYKIVSQTELRHQDIMGTIFSLGIKEDTFGDITRYQNDFYIFLLPHLANYFKYNLTEIRNNKIELVEVDIELKEKFKQEYIIKEYIVSSLRIDNVISTIINTSRNTILEKFQNIWNGITLLIEEKFQNKEIILNYDENTKPTRALKENDIFSIRKHGKYKFSKVLKTTKKGGYIIEILVYK